MSEILAAPKVRKPGSGWWLILDCEHWYKWTGAKAPRVGTELDCPSCKPPIVVTHPEPAPEAPPETT
jgi:hypothetical protein